MLNLYKFWLEWHAKQKTCSEGQMMLKGKPDMVMTDGEVNLCGLKSLATTQSLGDTVSLFYNKPTKNHVVYYAYKYPPVVE